MYLDDPANIRGVSKEMNAIKNYMTRRVYAEGVCLNLPISIVYIAKKVLLAH